MRFEEFYEKEPDVTPEFTKEKNDPFKPTKEEMDAQFAAANTKAQQRMDWWETPSYVQAVERQRAEAEKAATNDVQRAKRQRDAALITDIADVFARMYAQRGAGGAWRAPELQDRAGAANNAYMDALRRKDAVFVDFEGKMAQAKMQDYLNRKKQEQAEREYGLKVDAARRAEQQQAYKNRLELAKLHEQREEKKRDREFRAEQYEKNRKSQKDISAARNATSIRTAQLRGGRGKTVTEIDLGGGNVIEVDRDRWKTANKPAIAAEVKNAIITRIEKELKPEETKMYKEYNMIPPRLQKGVLNGVSSIDDLSVNKLFDVWREYPESIEYVKSVYGVRDDEEAGDGIVDYVPGSHKEEIIDYIPRK